MTAEKPQKPYPDFPLFAHQSGVWAKKIRGRTYYFGPWDNWQGALERYVKDKDALHSGTPIPRKIPEAIENSVLEICAKYLEDKKGTIEDTTFATYVHRAKRLVKDLGGDTIATQLTPDAFTKLRAKCAETMNPTTLAKQIAFTRQIFNYAYESGWLEKPLRFGPGFGIPSIRDRKQCKVVRLLEARHIRRLLRSATPTLRAMILLGINCGFGNNDCATLPSSAVNLQSGWIEYPRPKTAVDRRCPLWATTVEALRVARKARPLPTHNNYKNLEFLGPNGTPWKERVRCELSIVKQMMSLMQQNGMRKNGIGFYALRHTFSSIADASLDFPAKNLIMGHSDSTIAGNYRHIITDDRLIAVTDLVAKWLFRVRNASQVVWQPLFQ